MQDIRIKPYWLPQIKSSLSFVLKKLDEEGIKYRIITIDPNELSPLQGIAILDNVTKLKNGEINPIWISKNNEILDGHHRYCFALANELPIKAVQIMMNHQDCCRVLNKVQDIYEFLNQEKIMEVIAQNHLNMRNDNDSFNTNNDFLSILNIENIKENKKIGKKKKCTGYRKDKIKENSFAGNFFSNKKIDGYKEYNIEFDSILDTNDLKLVFNTQSSPVEELAKVWFPNINFEPLAKKNNINKISLINRAVAEMARKMGYDGIKYGDIMIQGF